MIKKITNIMLSLVLLMSLFIMSVYADEVNVINTPPVANNNVAATTSVDGSGGGKVNVGDSFVSSRVVADVQTQSGAEIRVMQLMRNVEANIQGAELILRVAQDCNCPEYDRMSEILNLLDVIAVELSEFEFSRSSREIAQEFVELKTDATELTTQFRELARQVISSEEDREELRELTREVRDNQREDFKQRIEERVRNHQIEQFRELVVRLDIQADELVRLAVAGEVSIPDARQQLAQILRERNQEERQQALQRVRESQTRENIELRERVREVEEVVRERVEQRDERLEERLIDRVQRVEERVSDRASPQLFEQVCQSAAGGGRSDRASAALFKQVCSGFGGDDSDEISEEERDRKIENLRSERLNILNSRIEIVQDRIQRDFLDSFDCKKFPERCREYQRIQSELDSFECERFPQKCRELRSILQDLRGVLIDVDEKTSGLCTLECSPVCAQPPIPECREGLPCPAVMPIPPLQTFENECMARTAGAQIKHRGECIKEVVGLQKKVIFHNDLEREFYIYVPTNFDSRNKYPVVFLLHGGGGSNSNFLEKTNFDKEAENREFILVVPNAVNGNWNDGRGKTARSQTYDNIINIDDVGFIITILDEIKNYLPIDSNRIYATGMSNGAFFSQHLACQRPDKFTAIAPVAGPMINDIEGICPSPTPIPVLGIQGTQDPFFPIINRDEVIPEFPKFLENQGLEQNPIRFTELTNFWKSTNKCRDDVISKDLPIIVDDGTSVTYYEFNSCSSRKSVIYYIIKGGGHTWPGSTPEDGFMSDIIGKTSNQINANQVILDFFEIYNLNDSANNVNQDENFPTNKRINTDVGVRIQQR